MRGYDIELVRLISDTVSIPVIACGGASGVADFRIALTEGRASAVAAGAVFVFHGPKRAVLIDFPEREVLNGLTGCNAIAGR
jgi:cyclase